MSPKDIVIIGGGISGLAALHFCRKMAPELSVRLFERENRLGGIIGTEKVDGYSFDSGPNGFLDREPLTLALCDDIGLSEKLERAGENVSKRYILRSGRLLALPNSLIKFLRSDILSLRGKLRLAMEPLVPAKRSSEDESIYAFGCRRIGREAAEYLIQPMVSGVFGGLAERLSLRSCFPAMTKMESEHGSLLMAMIAKKRQSRKLKNNGSNKSGSATASGPTSPNTAAAPNAPATLAGWLTSFEGGMYPLIETLTSTYASYIATGISVESIGRQGGNFSIVLSDGSVVSAGQVIIALPSYAAASITKGLSEQLAESLAAIPYAPIAVVCFGFRKEQVSRELDGFGFLVPSRENRYVLGSIWTSSIFSGRAPDNCVQFRTMIGGDGDHQSARLHDDELAEAALDDLREIIGLNGKPEITRVFRFKKGIPQYRIGHSELLNKIENGLKPLAGLYLTGNAYYGVGLNDCIKLSHTVVTSALEKRNRQRQSRSIIQ